MVPPTMGYSNAFTALTIRGQVWLTSLFNPSKKPSVSGTTLHQLYVETLLSMHLASAFQGVGSCERVDDSERGCGLVMILNHTYLILQSLLSFIDTVVFN
eukprot:GHVN01088697.1.p1 GENE.GHVN01088697.1~~GHVN01088697.1.p1  ORF type:complete len:100 (+),score=5.28 GHVN01088697.1:358-657(+)